MKARLTKEETTHLAEALKHYQAAHYQAALFVGRLDEAEAVAGLLRAALHLGNLQERLEAAAAVDLVNQEEK